MDEDIAASLIDDWLNELRTRSYQQLVALTGTVQTRETTGADGKWYQLEAQFFWDARKGGDVRVMVAGDDGGLRA